MNPSKKNMQRVGARRAAAAFTLLEMMLVVAIIGILMSVAVINLVGQSEKTRVKATGASMRTLVTSLKGYKADKGVYPTSLQALVSEKYIEKVFKDAWKQEFIFASPGAGGKDFSLLSPGPDLQQGTDDDIDWWKVEEDQ